MMKKRIISLLLTVAMLISALPIIANADAVVSTPSIKSTSLTLEGILELNVKVDPGSSDMSGYKVVASIGEESQECTLDDKSSNSSLYVYKAKIPAHKLNETVTIQLLNENNEVIDEGNWTLDAYLAYQVDRDPGLSDLAYALDLYAKNAAAYATNSESTSPETAVEQEDLEAYKCEVVTPGEIVPSAVLLLNDAATLRVQMNEDLWKKPALFDMNLGELETIPDGWQYRDDGKVIADKSVWSANAGVLKSTGTSGKNQVLLFDTSIDEDNYEITANVVMHAGGSIGLVFANNHYFRLNCSSAANNTFLLSAGYTTENFKSMRTTCAANKQLGSSYGLVVGEVATLKVVVEGTTFTVYINGQIACSEDTATRTGDTHGAYAMSDLHGKFGLLQMNASGEGFGFMDIKTETTVTQNAQSDETYSLKINGEAVTLTHDAAKQIYYYDIENIRAQDWGTKYAVAIVGTDSETLFACNYGVLSYVYTVLGNQANYTKELNLLKSMFLYYQGTVNYANAELFDYSLTYNANYEGSDETKVDSAKITATSKNFKVADNTFARPGYKFTGWNTKPDGSGTSYDVGSTLTLNVVDVLMNEEFNAVSDTWTQYDTSVAVDTDVWSAADGTLKYTGTSTGNSALIFDDAIEADNYELTTQIMMPSAGSIGLVFAASEDGKDMHYFRIFISGNEYRLYAGRFTNGMVESNMDTRYSKAISSNGYVLKPSEMTDVAKNMPVTLKVTVEGQNFSIYANDKLWLSGTTEGENLHGKVGLFLRNGAAATNHSFDDVKVSASNTTATLYAQWEEDILFSQNLVELTTNPEGWRHINNGYYVTTDDVHDTSAWSVSDGAMKCNITTNNQVLRLGEIDAENYEITVNVVMQSERGGSIGLAFGENHYFRIWLNSSGYWRLYAGDTSNMYASAPQNGVIHEQTLPSGHGLSAGRSATLKVKVEGSIFTIYVNGVECASATATTNLTGWFGLFQRGNLGTGGFVDIRVDEIVPTAG